MLSIKSNHLMVILISFVVYSAIKIPSFPDSIITLILAGVTCFLLWLEKKEVPDIKKELLTIINKQQEEIGELKNEIGKVGISLSRGVVNDKIRF